MEVQWLLPRGSIKGRAELQLSSVGVLRAHDPQLSLRMTKPQTRDWSWSIFFSIE